MTNDIANSKFLTETAKLARTIQASYLELGKRLAKIRNENLFAPAHDSFSEYLWEIRLSDSTASRIIFAWEKLVAEYGIEEEKIIEVGWSDAYAIGKQAKDKEEAESMLEEYGGQTSTDTRRGLTERKKGVSMSDCKHDEDYYDIRVCRRCGMKYRLLDEHK